MPTRPPDDFHGVVRRGDRLNIVISLLQDLEFRDVDALMLVRQKRRDVVDTKSSPAWGLRKFDFEDEEACEEARVRYELQEDL